MTCPLTGRVVSPLQLGDQRAFCYETPETGMICFTDIAFSEAQTLSLNEKYILAGISRNRTIRQEKPEPFTSTFLRTLMMQNIPYTFEGRARHLLKYFYDHGGVEYKDFNFRTNLDSSIAYAAPEEFNRILRSMKSDNWIDYVDAFVAAGSFREIRMTKLGISEVEKGKPKMPLFGLVSQEISTGDASIDASIEQARKAFFNEPTSFDSKRSACETLSYIVEPFRKELEGLFEGDTEYFFRIVNEFSVRHNKLSTKRINSEEQLEWVFYSLLNTINTYYKMKRKSI